MHSHPSQPTCQERTRAMKHLTRICLLAAACLLTAPLAYATDGQIKLPRAGDTEGQTITIGSGQSGSYILTRNWVITDASTNGIVILAEDVTLDLNGHTVRGPGSGTGFGITSDERNIEVKNGVVRGFGVDGIDLAGMAYSGDMGYRVEGIRASDNGRDGIHVWRGTISGCATHGNGDNGINASDVTISGCTAYRNADDGIEATTSTVYGCDVRENGTEDDPGTPEDETEGWGISLPSSNAKCYVYRNAVSGNKAGQINDPGGNRVEDDNATW